MVSQTKNFTIGIEEEYQIIHPDTYELHSSSSKVLPGAKEVLGAKAQPELQLSQIEAATPVCQNLEDARSALIHMRRAMVTAAEQQNKLLAAAGTHPFSHWKNQHITPKAHYREVAKNYQQLARDTIFGCHVHVGLNEREMALQVMNRARVWLAPLLALSANSPFSLGTDTGYASFRSLMWSRWPTAGQPQYFSSLAEYDELLQTLINTGMIEDATTIYWDIRLSEHFNTIEFRVADCCMTVDETMMLVGLIRAIVQTCYEEVQSNDLSPQVRPELLRAAHWRASRYGIDERLIDVVKQRSLPSQEIMDEMLSTLRPALEAESCWQEVSSQVQKVLHEGNGATRQRAVYQRNEDLKEVVEYIVAETRKGIF